MQKHHSLSQPCNQTYSQEYDAIRSYRDDEVTNVLNRLQQDTQFVQAMAQYFYPLRYRWFPKKVKAAVSRTITKRFTAVHDIDTFQNKLVRPALKQLLNKTVTRFSFSGIDHLQKGCPYLLLSNHRDIVLDPAFVNYALYINGFPTPRIAIGDNLLHIPFVADLMRLNKSFIVKRSVRGFKEKVYELKRLSAYINTLIQHGDLVWLANREGRAKDGLDSCDPAIIKMLYLSQKTTMDFATVMKNMHIIPVVISYEYDPCDLLKARELLLTSKYGKYVKEQGEDMVSIVQGITGNKGKVHVHFGKVLEQEQYLTSPEQIAWKIDEENSAHYRLYASNFTAYRELFGQTFTGLLLERYQLKAADFSDKNFLLRLARVPEELRHQFLAIYANPVTQKYPVSELEQDANISNIMSKQRNHARPLRYTTPG